MAFDVEVKDIQPTVTEPVPGVAITLGPKRYLMPRLTAKLLKKHSDVLQKIAKLTPEEQADAVAVIGLSLPVILDALGRNYKDLTIAELEEAIEVGEPFNELIRAMMGQAGYRPPAPGE